MSTINASHTKINKQLIKSQTRQINSQLGIKLISNYLSVGKQRGSIPFVNPSRGCLGRDHEIIADPTWQTSPLGNTQYNAFRFQDSSVVLTKIQNAAKIPRNLPNVMQSPGPDRQYYRSLRTFYIGFCHNALLNFTLLCSI